MYLLGIPLNPKKCIGKNTKFKKKKEDQKCILEKKSLNLTFKIIGNQ